MKEIKSQLLAYESPKKEWWQGRNDGNKISQLRFWQHIQLASSLENNLNFNNAPVILGFACDEGVARNKGRIGSVNGPLKLRKALSNVPVYNADTPIFDAGNIHCIETNLEEAQTKLATSVSAILKNNGFPILLGGGHEILYGHYTGTSNYFDTKKVGVINFDAHFDIRKPENKVASSGTGFYQIAEDCQNKNKDFLYLALGIQQSGNTKELFNIADSFKTEYILAQDFHTLNLEKIKTQVLNFLAKTDVVCLTIDLDVFSASIAPGVSAPSAAGIFYNYTFREILKLLVKSNKVVSLDIAEYNPVYDIDSHTAKLASQLIFDWIHEYLKIETHEKS